MCKFGCSGVARNLCCPEQAPFIDIAREYCGSGFVTELAVVHNIQRYGGSGARGFAVTTLNDESLGVFIHELGHSFFGLGDEYQNSLVDTDYPNCAKTSDCQEWSDLLARPQFNVKCVPACKNGQYRAGGVTIMDVLGNPFGAVNERIACCKYLFNGHRPTFCHRFDQDGLDLRQYCRTAVWKSEPLLVSSLLQVGSERHLQSRAMDRQGDRFVFVKMPVEWRMTLLPIGWSCRKVAARSTGLYPRMEVEGIDKSHPWLAESASSQTVTVRVKSKSGMHLRKIQFATVQNVETPMGVFFTPGAVIPEPLTSFPVVLQGSEVCVI